MEKMSKDFTGLRDEAPLRSDYIAPNIEELGYLGDFTAADLSTEFGD